MNSSMLIFSNVLVLINAFIIIFMVKLSQIWSEASSNWLLCPGDTFLSFPSTSVLSAVILHSCSSGFGLLQIGGPSLNISHVAQCPGPTGGHMAASYHFTPGSPLFFVVVVVGFCFPFFQVVRKL